MLSSLRVLLKLLCTGGHNFNGDSCKSAGEFVAILQFFEAVIYFYVDLLRAGDGMEAKGAGSLLWDTHSRCEPPARREAGKVKSSLSEVRSENPSQREIPTGLSIKGSSNT